MIFVERPHSRRDPPGMKYGIQMETREWMPRDRFLLVTAQQLAEIDATIARLARLLLR